VKLGTCLWAGVWCGHWQIGLQMHAGVEVLTCQGAPSCHCCSHLPPATLEHGPCLPFAHHCLQHQVQTYLITLGRKSGLHHPSSMITLCNLSLWVPACVYFVHHCDPHCKQPSMFLEPNCDAASCKICSIWSIQTSL